MNLFEEELKKLDSIEGSPKFEAVQSKSPLRLPNKASESTNPKPESGL